MGNTLLVTPMLTALRQQFPETRVSVLVWANGSDAVLRGLTTIDELFVMPTHQAKYKTLLAWARRLRSTKVSHVIVAWPVGISSALLALLSGAPVRVGHVLGYWPPLSHLFLTNAVEWRTNIRHDLKRNLELAAELGAQITSPPPIQIALSPSDCEFANTFLQEHRDSSPKPLFGLAPGSGRSQEFKRWPADRFAELGNRLIADLGGDVLLFIGPGEKELTRVITAKMQPRPLVVCDKTIHQVAALMSKCKVIVSNDAGLMHVAVAVGVPVVAVVGPIDPRRTRPYGIRNRVVSLELPCSPCYDHFRLGFACSHNPPFECLKALEPDTVLSAVTDVLQQEIS